MIDGEGVTQAIMRTDLAAERANCSLGVLPASKYRRDAWAAGVLCDDGKLWRDPE